MATQNLRQDERADGTAALLDVLGRLVRTARAAGHRHQAEYGLGGAPLGNLEALATADARVGDLAARLQIAPAVVSRALAPLDKAGLVERQHDHDARAARLGLTDAGRDRLDSARREFADRFAPLPDPWEDADVAALIQLMDRLESTLAEGLDLHSPAHGSRSPSRTSS